MVTGIILCGLDHVFVSITFNRIGQKLWFYEISEANIFDKSGGRSMRLVMIHRSDVSQFDKGTILIQLENIKNTIVAKTGRTFYQQ